MTELKLKYYFLKDIEREPIEKSLIQKGLVEEKLWDLDDREITALYKEYCLDGVFNN